MTSTEKPQFTNSFSGEALQVPAETLQVPAETTPRRRSSLQDYQNTPEWDASKTPPSRFQKRKGSIYATPSSRDGHVERNRDAVEEFHKAHSKRWSVSSGSSSRRSSSSHGEQQRRKSSIGGFTFGGSGQ
ncbi:hypothetical protein DL770_004471 [Monosporascus sp. CRB-9-2]|nr:hypothetical protein DL770_004471 [Monosporascus sp. CRB-9-2]